MGRGEKASAESRVSAGRLQDTISISSEGWGRNNNVSSCPFRVTFRVKSVKSD